jgi:hypothetical protein
MNTLTLYRRLTAQRAYERRVAAFGAPAAVAPYARPVARIRVRETAPARP